MDGISNYQLEIEAMTREEIRRQLDLLLDWSMNSGWFPGKQQHQNYLMMVELTEELQIRRLAE